MRNLKKLNKIKINIGSLVVTGENEVIFLQGLDIPIIWPDTISHFTLKIRI